MKAKHTPIFDLLKTHGRYGRDDRQEAIDLRALSVKNCKCHTCQILGSFKSRHGWLEEDDAV